MQGLDRPLLDGIRYELLYLLHALRPFDISRVEGDFRAWVTAVELASLRQRGSLDIFQWREFDLP